MAPLKLVVALRGRATPTSLAAAVGPAPVLGRTFRRPFPPISIRVSAAGRSAVVARAFATDTKPESSDGKAKSDDIGATEKNHDDHVEAKSASDWESKDLKDVLDFKNLPDATFGMNQHMPFNSELKEVLKRIVWDMRAPIRYAFAYGSGVFPQSKHSGRVASLEEFRAVHPKAPAVIQQAQDGSPKMIDFVFVVTHSQHFHSLNMRHNRQHYSSLASLGSGVVAHVQDKWGAGVYYNPYVVVDGVLIKYGVVQMDTLERDLTEWDTLYLAGRLHKPVKILRDDARIRFANQVNLIAALRTALLLLPPNFNEMELYSTIAGISYLGDPRMALPAENPSKVNNIVANNLPNFRRLYLPLIQNLPNVDFNDPRRSEKDWALSDAYLKLAQDMDPIRRGNMVRRLPKAFRSRLYFQYQKKLAIPQADFDKMIAESAADDVGAFRRREGGGFERRIAQDDPAELRAHLRTVIKQTVGWPSATQSAKGVLTAGISRSLRYVGEKVAKWRRGSGATKDEGEAEQPARKEEKKAEAGGDKPN